MPPPDSSPAIQAISRPRSQLEGISASVPPWALVVVAIVSVQFGAAVAKQLFDTVGPSGVVFLRTILAAVMFAFLRPQLLGYRWQDYLKISFYGVTIAGMMLTFYAAISRIPLGITVTIAFGGPLSVAVIGSRQRRDLMWVGLALVGILLLSPFTGDSLDPLGLLLAVGAAVTWAVYILISGRISRIFPLKSGLSISMAVAALVTAPFGAINAAKVLMEPGVLIISLGVAVLSSAIPFGLEFNALRKMPPRVFGMLASLEPVIAALIGFIILHEALGAREIVGIVMVTIAAVATARSVPG